MTKIKYDADVMKIIQIFETFTRAKVKDCVPGEKILFIVEENDIGCREKGCEARYGLCADIRLTFRELEQVFQHSPPLLSGSLLFTDKPV